MTEPSRPSQGRASSWISLIAGPGLAGMATGGFTVDGSAERFESVGMFLAVITFYAVCVPRERWGNESAEPGNTTSAPTWHRRMTPFLLGAGGAYVLAATLVGYWHTAAFVTVGLVGACATLVTRRDEPTTSLSTWQKRTAFALLAVGVALLIPAVRVGNWGPPVILAFCLGLVGVAVATDSRRGGAEPLVRT